MDHDLAVLRAAIATKAREAKHSPDNAQHRADLERLRRNYRAAHLAAHTQEDRRRSARRG